jgi:hypothetical protein
MFKVVTTIYQQTSVGPSENNNNDCHENRIKSREAKWLLEFIGGKYDCAGKASSNCE